MFSRVPVLFQYWMHLSKTNESFLSRNNKQLFPFRTDPVLTFFAHLAVLCAPWCVERRSCDRPGVEHGEFPNRSPAGQLSSHFVPTDIQSIRTKIWTFCTTFVSVRTQPAGRFLPVQTFSDDRKTSVHRCWLLRTTSNVCNWSSVVCTCDIWGAICAKNINR